MIIITTSDIDLIHRTEKENKIPADTLLEIYTSLFNTEIVVIKSPDKFKGIMYSKNSEGFKKSTGNLEWAKMK